MIRRHTGFKGSWLCRILANAGAEVMGYGLEPPTDPNLFNRAELEGRIKDVRGDVRDYETMLEAFHSFRPEIVMHLATQTIVREGYKDPRYTFETNVMGTVNLMECVRQTDSVKSVLNVTTDKVYRNNEWEWGYRENEALCGRDPYANSKSCSELVTKSYVDSFLSDQRIAVSTARAGNVIGGGDFAKDRIVPDCVRAVSEGKTIIVRNPYSIRPYQHVLEPLSAYLMIIQRQYEDPTLAGNYNVGPLESDCITTGELADLFCEKWGEGAKWENIAENGAPFESNFLKLDCSHIRKVLGWTPKWDIKKAIEMTCEFARKWNEGGDISEEMDREIREYFG